MSFFNTGNPVPSNDPRDLDDNAMHVDELVNSTELTYTDRLGTERLTMAGIEAEAASSATLRSDLAADDGSDLVGFKAAGTGAEAMTLQDKGRISGLTVVEFMTDAERADALTGAPVLNHSGAFTDFIAAVITKGGRGRIPKGTYRLNTNVIGNWTQVIEYDEGAVLTGAGILFAVQHILNQVVGTKEIRRGVSDPSSGVVSRYFTTTNETPGGGYGVRFDYRQTVTNTSGFSLGIGNICQWDSINGGAGESMWNVATTPILGSGGTWGVVCEEQNIVNRGPDNGYVKTRGEQARWCGAMQVVPEATDLSGGTGVTGRNAAFGYCTAASSFVNDLGFRVKFYNGLMIEKDSIGPDGRGVLASGDSSGVASQLPMYGLEIDQRWAQGINTTAATFTSSIAINLGNGHVFTWGGTGPSLIGSQTTGLLRIASSGAGAIAMIPGGAGSGAMQFAPVASTVNLFSVSGGATGNSPQSIVAGADTDINYVVAAKGANGRFQCNVGSIAVNTAGKGLQVREGANAKQGVATLVAGTVVVANTSVTATSRIMLTSQVDGGTPGFLRVSTRAVGTSFTILSSSAADTSTVAYQIFEPA